MNVVFFLFLKVFAAFLSFMPNFHFVNKMFKFLTLFGMKLKKSAKARKNEKMQHPNECFKSIKPFRRNFFNYAFFLACFERKIAKKNMFFVIFSKIVIFGKK